MFYYSTLHYTIYYYSMIYNLSDATLECPRWFKQPCIRVRKYVCTVVLDVDFSCTMYMIYYDINTICYCITICISISLSLSIYIYIYIYICIYVHIHIVIHVCTYIYIYIYTQGTTRSMCSLRLQRARICYYVSLFSLLL